jgi:lipopolysaccharide biosynthesis glycosyltransferase
MFRIFIGWDSRFPEPADVLRYSLQKYSSIPLDIRYLKMSELDFERSHDPLQSTEFTYTRFLLPHLCNFQGTALFLDNDMLALGDVREIAEMDMSEMALRVVQHDYSPTNTVKMYGAVQTSYPRKNWSSMMLMNCARLKVWTKEVVQTQTGAYLHRFQDIPDSQIGELPKTWNTLDWMDGKTKLIHYTNGGPWFKDYENHPHAGVWNTHRDEMKRAALRAPHIRVPMPTMSPVTS